MSTENKKKVRTTEEQLTSGHLEARKLQMYAWRSAMYRIPYKNDASPEEKAAWEPLTDYFLMQASIAEYVLECREREVEIEAARKRLATVEEATRSYPTALNFSARTLRAELDATVSYAEKRIQDLKEYISNFRQEIAQKQDFYDHLLSYVRINPDDKFYPEKETMKAKTTRKYRSGWKLVIYEALYALGIDSSYKMVVDWIVDKFPGVERPAYFGVDVRKDIGLLIANNEKMRKQFQRDVTRVRKEMKQDASDI